MDRMKENWKNTPQWVKIICYVFLGIASVIALGFLFGLLIKLLWNWLMPELFGLKEISYWQGIGIFILARIIFGSVGGNSSSPKSKNDKKIQADKCNDNDKADDKDHSTRNYDEWWEAEGKKAFDDYMENKYNSSDTNER